MGKNKRPAKKWTCPTVSAYTSAEVQYAREYLRYIDQTDTDGAVADWVWEQTRRRNGTQGQDGVQVRMETNGVDQQFHRLPNGVLETENEIRNRTASHRLPQFPDHHLDGIIVEVEDGASSSSTRKRKSRSSSSSSSKSDSKNTSDDNMDLPTPTCKKDKPNSSSQFDKDGEGGKDGISRVDYSSYVSDK